MKNLINSRRGIAIEMAIGAMFIMIALSIVLISISGMQTQYMKNDLNEFDEKLECYYILDYLIENQTLTDSNIAEIEVTIEGIKHQYTLEKIENNEYIVKDTEGTVLTFTTDAEGKITSWGN